MISPHVVISGPCTWNSLLFVPALPQPEPHMIVVDDFYDTFGGTSLGKCMNLSELGCDVTIVTQFGSDEMGHMIRDLLTHVGATVINCESRMTERHTNIMAADGQRLSFYLTSPPPSSGQRDDEILKAMSTADAIVMDLSAESARLLPAIRTMSAPVWVDLHDYDGRAQFHEPFLEAADVVVMSADKLDDPVSTMHEIAHRGKDLVVCTRGDRGALALTDSKMMTIPASPTQVVDTNGAGDAFASAALYHLLAGQSVHDALTKASLHTHQTLRSRHIHPVVDAILAS